VRKLEKDLEEMDKESRRLGLLVAGKDALVEEKEEIIKDLHREVNRLDELVRGRNYTLVGQIQEMEANLTAMRLNWNQALATSLAEAMEKERAALAARETGMEAMRMEFVAAAAKQRGDRESDRKRHQEEKWKLEEDTIRIKSAAEAEKRKLEQEIAESSKTVLALDAKLEESKKSALAAKRAHEEEVRFAQAAINESKMKLNEEAEKLATLAREKEDLLRRATEAEEAIKASAAEWARRLEEKEAASRELEARLQQADVAVRTAEEEKLASEARLATEASRRLADERSKFEALLEEEKTTLAERLREQHLRLLEEESQRIRKEEEGAAARRLEVALEDVRVKASREVETRVREEAIRAHAEVRAEAQRWLDERLAARTLEMEEKLAERLAEREPEATTAPPEEITGEALERKIREAEIRARDAVTSQFASEREEAERRIAALQKELEKQRAIEPPRADFGRREVENGRDKSPVRKEEGDSDYRTDDEDDDGANGTVVVSPRRGRGRSPGQNGGGGRPPDKPPGGTDPPGDDPPKRPGDGGDRDPPKRSGDPPGGDGGSPPRRPGDSGGPPDDGDDPPPGGGGGGGKKPQRDRSRSPRGRRKEKGKKDKREDSPKRPPAPVVVCLPLLRGEGAPAGPNPFVLENGGPDRGAVGDAPMDAGGDGPPASVGTGPGPRVPGPTGQPPAGGQPAQGNGAQPGGGSDVIGGGGQGNVALPVPARAFSHIDASQLCLFGDLSDLPSAPIPHLFVAANNQVTPFDPTSWPDDIKVALLADARGVMNVNGQDAVWRWQDLAAPVPSSTPRGPHARMPVLAYHDIVANVILGRPKHVAPLVLGSDAVEFLEVVRTDPTFSDSIVEACKSVLVPAGVWYNPERKWGTFTKPFYEEGTLRDIVRALQSLDITFNTDSMGDRFVEMYATAFLRSLMVYLCGGKEEEGKAWANWWGLTSNPSTSDASLALLARDIARFAWSAASMRNHLFIPNVNQQQQQQQEPCRLPEEGWQTCPVCGQPGSMGEGTTAWGALYRAADSALRLRSGFDVEWEAWAAVVRSLVYHVVGHCMPPNHCVPPAQREQFWMTR
jgi:hypothetical protein